MKIIDPAPEGLIRKFTDAVPKFAVRVPLPARTTVSLYGLPVGAVKVSPPVTVQPEKV